MSNSYLHQGSADACRFWGTLAYADHVMTQPSPGDGPRVPDPDDLDDQDDPDQRDSEHLAVVPVRDAATVMVVREGHPGVEVVLLRRHLSASFVAGAWVFPGGAVDPSDGELRVTNVVVGLNDHDASQVLGLDHGGLRFWVAAVRESFEESGVLLAVTNTNREWLAAADLASNEMRDARVAVHDGTLAFADFLRQRGLVIDASRVKSWSRWVTPIGSPRRFDTRFFLAEAPPWSEPAHDQRETIASRWARPHEALEEFRNGEISLIYPTVKSLEVLSRATTVSEAFASRR
jgi:8-oxo-dGTP pyrophosphatase MutT (NUDIX family)